MNNRVCLRISPMNINTGKFRMSREHTLEFFVHFRAAQLSLLLWRLIGRRLWIPHLVRLVLCGRGGSGARNRGHHKVIVWALTNPMPQLSSFGSIAWHSMTFFRLFTLFTGFFFDFQLFRFKYHWRDFISRNAHLVHQNWYRINFTQSNC